MEIPKEDKGDGGKRRGRGKARVSFTWKAKRGAMMYGEMKF